MNKCNKLVAQAQRFLEIVQSALPFSQIEYLTTHEDSEEDFKELYMTVNGCMPSAEFCLEEEYYDDLAEAINRDLPEWIRLSDKGDKE